VAESLVEVQPASHRYPDFWPDAWAELDALVEQGDYWEMLLPSEFASRRLLRSSANQFDVRRRDDPLRCCTTERTDLSLLRLQAEVDQGGFADRSRAHLRNRRLPGFFAHVMITLVRTKLQIPCRYVSGYLYHGERMHGPVSPLGDPCLGRGFASGTGLGGIRSDELLVAGDRHIRTAIGRDYSDVPPTHGIFRGRARASLTVAVRVTPSEGTPSLDQELPVPEDWSILVEKETALPDLPPAPTRFRAD
jgi:hypothetical protein